MANRRTALARTQSWAIWRLKKSMADQNPWRKIDGTLDWGRASTHFPFGGGQWDGLTSLWATWAVLMHDPQGSGS